MKLLVSLVFLVAGAFAKDAIIWSTNDISQTSLSSATKSNEITIFALNGFSMGEFSKRANVYSSNSQVTGIINAIKNANHKQESLESPLEVDSNSKVIEASSWEDLEGKFEEFIQSLNGQSYTAAIVDSNNIEKNSVRSKRAAATATPAPITGEASGTGPVIAPTDYSKNASCLFYLEGLSLIYYEHNGKVPYKATHLDFTNSTDSYKVKYACGYTHSDSTFDVSINTKGIQNGKDGVSVDGQDIKFTIKVSPVGYYTWQITEFTLTNAEVTVEGNKHKISNATNTSQAGVKFLDALMYSDYGYACSQTSAVFAPSDGENKIGMTLVGFQIQMVGAKKVGDKFYGFVPNMNDCVPTFSVGSWMSLISAIILAAVLLFGFLMLNSVQTMDRFDDPKAKQIVINFKDLIFVFPNTLYMPDEATQAQYNDFAKFVKFLSTRLIQIVVQARMGEKLSHRCTPDPHLSDWFNLKIDEIGEVAKYLKKNVLHYPPKIDAVNIDFYLYTSDRETLPLETWSLYVDSSNIDNTINVRTDLYHRMGTLLKSAYSSSRVLPSYRYYVKKQSSETYVILYRIYNGAVDEKSFGENHKYIRLGELPSPFGYVCLDVRYRTSMKISVYEDELKEKKEETLEKSDSETTETLYKNATKPINIVPKIGSQIITPSPMSDFGNAFGVSPASLDMVKHSPKEHPRFMLGRSHSSSDDSSIHSFMKQNEYMSDEALASAIFLTSTTHLHGSPTSYNPYLRPRVRHNSLPFETLLNDSPLIGSQHTSTSHLPILTEETFMSGSKSTMSLMPLKSASAAKPIRHSQTIPSRVDSLKDKNYAKNDGLNSPVLNKKQIKNFTTYEEDEDYTDDYNPDDNDKKKKKKSIEDEFYVNLFPLSSMESLGENLKEFERECRLAPDELPSFLTDTSLNIEDQLSQFRERQSSFDKFVAQINEKRGSYFDNNQE